MNPLILCAALALPLATPFYGPGMETSDKQSATSIETRRPLVYSQSVSPERQNLARVIPIDSKPYFPFRRPEVEIVRMLRDYPDYENWVARRNRWVLIYGALPSWKLALENAGVKVVGMWKQGHTRWHGWIVGTPVKLPFKDRHFNVYIFDDIEENWNHKGLKMTYPYGDLDHILEEAERVLAPRGFFLCRLQQMPAWEFMLPHYRWRRYEFDFHDFSIWYRDDPAPPEVQYLRRVNGWLWATLKGIKDELGRRWIKRPNGEGLFASA